MLTLTPSSLAALIAASLLAFAAPGAQPERSAHQDGDDDEAMGWTGVLDEDSFAALHELNEGQAPALRGEDITIGETIAYMSRPEEVEPVGAVLVIHEWWGLNDHVKHWADRLAADGYVAVAVDLYGGVVATTREEAMASMQGIDEEAALETLRLAHAFLVEDERVLAERTACIGWCFGGGWSLRLAMAEPELDAAVMYYGRLVTDVEALSGIEAPMLGVFGARDRGIPPSAVAEFEAAMEDAGKSLEVHSYEADHAFANPSSARYDAEHAAQAWREARAFLCRHLWPAQSDDMVSDGSRELELHEPDGWELGGERPMRTVTFAIGSETECYVAALRGEAGGVLANINRWRGQLGMDALTEGDLEELPRVTMLGELAVTMRAEGDYTGMRGEKIEDAVMLGAICMLEEEVIFVKLLGPRSEVDGEGGRFVAFCQGLR